VIKVRQRCALRQHSCKGICPDCSDLITVRTTSVQEQRLFSSPVDWENVDRAVDSHSEGVLEES